MFETKRAAYGKFVQYMMLAFKSVEMFVEEDEKEDYYGSFATLEAAQKALEKAQTEEELDEIMENLD